jgi:hypothetical protein
VNHRLPSGPAAMSWGKPPHGNPVNTPLVVILPICDPLVNHRLPSGPAVMPSGKPPLGNSVKTPLVVILPILAPSGSVNQSQAQR